MTIEYKPPVEIIVFQCPFCKCRFNSKADYDTHFDEQHGKTGLPFCISMSFPPTDEDDNERQTRM